MAGRAFVRDGSALHGRGEFTGAAADAVRGALPDITK
jgi:hypothetical protein